jgi:glycosyltransferase involved in cell wall biosynthesis
MKILFYSHFYPPEVGAAPTRIKYFVNALREKGFEVKVIAPKPNYPLGKVFEGYQKKIVINQSSEGITYLPILFVGSHSPLGRLISYLSYGLFSFFYLLFKSERFDVVISSSPPIFTSLAAVIYSKAKGSRFIFDIRDIWPDIGVELGILKNQIYITGLAKIEEYILSNSDKIIVTAEGDKNNIVSKIGDTNKCEIIFNGADTNIFKLISEPERLIVRKKYKVPIDKKVIVYFGSYNHGMNDIEALGSFLSDERLVTKNLHFLSIGAGDHLPNLIQRIDGKITYTSILALPMEKVAELVAASDLSIIPRKNIKNDTGGNIPVKCFESWAAGIPVLLSNIEDAEVTRIFTKCNAGVIVKPNNVDALISGMNEISRKDLKKLSKEGRKFVIENFDRKRQSNKLSKIVTDK